MKKSVIIAAGMAIVLLLYGYLVTEFGHDEEHHEDHAVHSEQP